MVTQTQRNAFLTNARAHYEADMLLQGAYATTREGRFRGCSVGCHLYNIHPGWPVNKINYIVAIHAVVARYYGIPEWLVHLQDTMFEELPDGESMKWHVQLAETLHELPDDFDWQTALHRVHIGILRTISHTTGPVQEIVQRAIDLHKRASRSENMNYESWDRVQNTARKIASSAYYGGVAWAVVWSTDWEVSSIAASDAARSVSCSFSQRTVRSEIRERVLSALRNPEKI